MRQSGSPFGVNSERTGRKGWCWPCTKFESILTESQPFDFLGQRVVHGGFPPRFTTKLHSQSLQPPLSRLRTRSTKEEGFNEAGLNFRIAQFFRSVSCFSLLFFFFFFFFLDDTLRSIDWRNETKVVSFLTKMNFYRRKKREREQKNDDDDDLRSLIVRTNIRSNGRIIDFFEFFRFYR